MLSNTVFSVAVSDASRGRYNLYFPDYPAHADKPTGFGKVIMYLGVWDVKVVEVTPEYLTYEAVETREA